LRRHPKRNIFDQLFVIERFRTGIGSKRILDFNLRSSNFETLKETMMSIRALMAVSVAVLATVSDAWADPITDAFNGSYTAIDTVTGPYAPTINDDGGAFFNSPFAGQLTVGQTTTPQTFLQVAPANAPSSIGTQTGSIQIAMKLSDIYSGTVTGVTTSAGGNVAFAAGGTLYFSANYELFYGNQTDCLTWSGPSCSVTGNTNTIGETLAVSFSDGALLDINLYNWSDWDMAPDISFDLVSGAGVPVPEPASFAVFGAALAGFALIRRRLTV